MHVDILVGIALLALGLRWFWRRNTHSWHDRWQRAIVAFSLPPLLMVSSAIAVISMGRQGHMLGLPVGQLGYLLAWGIMAGALLTGVFGFWQGWRSLQYLRQYPIEHLPTSHSAHVIDTPLLMAAQVGFWHPQLVVSRGLVHSLTSEQLQAVLIHETAHEHYRDTFWFFWLGWLKRFSLWLPQTHALWQELLLLRELRADGWAAQQVDPITLAEALVHVVRSPLTAGNATYVAFGEAAPSDRLEERISHLLDAPISEPSHSPRLWPYLLIALLPLTIVVLHQ